MQSRACGTVMCRIRSTMKTSPPRRMQMSSRSWPCVILADLVSQLFDPFLKGFFIDQNFGNNIFVVLHGIPVSEQYPGSARGLAALWRTSRVPTGELRDAVRQRASYISAAPTITTGSWIACRFSVDQALGPRGRFTADHADGLEFVHVLGACHQHRHRAERFAAKIRIQSCHDDADLPGRLILRQPG